MLDQHANLTFLSPFETIVEYNYWKLLGSGQVEDVLGCRKEERCDWGSKVLIFHPESWW